MAALLTRIQYTFLVPLLFHFSFDLLFLFELLFHFGFDSAFFFTLAERPVAIVATGFMVRAVISMNTFVLFFRFPIALEEGIGLF